MIARKGDTPEYVRRMQKELFKILSEARCRQELHIIEPRALEVSGRYRDMMDDAVVFAGDKKYLEPLHIQFPFRS